MRIEIDIDTTIKVVKAQKPITAKKEIHDILKSRHITENEIVQTSVGRWKRFDYHSNHLGTSYYFVNVANQKIRIDL